MLNLKDRILLLQSSTKSEKAVNLCRDAYRVCGNKMFESTVSEQLLNNLDSEKSDVAVRQFIDRETKLNKVQNLGIKESYSALCKSDIMMNPTIRPILERMSIAVNTIPEYVIAESYLQTLDAFSWNPIAKSQAEDIRRKINENKEDIFLCSFLYEAKQSNSYLLPGFERELDTYFISKTRENREALMNKIKPYMFEGRVQNLYKKLQESCEDFQPTVDGSVTIEKIFSPVISKNGATIFCNEGRFFAKTKTNLTLLNEEQVAKLPHNFLKLCQNLNRNNVRVDESKIEIGANNKIITLVQESKNVKVNGREVDYNLFTRSFINEGLLIGANRVNESLNQISNIYENLNTIVEIDFGKHITSNTYKGHSADLYRFGNNISILESNKEFGTYKFIASATATQARKLLIEHLNYDIKDTFCDISSTEKVKVDKYEKEKAAFEKNLEHLQNKKSQLLEAVKTDPYLSESDDITKLLEAIDLEISKLQNEILTRNNLIKNITSTSSVKMFEDEEFAEGEPKSDPATAIEIKTKDDEMHKDEEPSKGGALKAGDQVQLKNGALGTVQGFENGGDNCIILMHDGKTVSVEKEFLNEITVVKSISKKINPEISMQTPNGSMSVEVLESEEVCPKCGKNPCICDKEEGKEKCPECGTEPCTCATKEPAAKVPGPSSTPAEKTEPSSDPKAHTLEVTSETDKIPPQGTEPEQNVTVKSVLPSITADKVEAQLVDDAGNIVIDKILIDPEIYASAADNDKIQYMTSGNSYDVFNTAKKYVKVLI